MDPYSRKVLSVALMRAYGTIVATPSAAMIILDNYNSSNSFHRILTSLNIFSLWQVLLTGIGLGRLSGKSSLVGIIIALDL